VYRVDVMDVPPPVERSTARLNIQVTSANRGDL